MGAQDVAQRLVQQVRGRMVGAQPRAALAVDPSSTASPIFTVPFDDRARMDEQAVALLLRVGDLDAPSPDITPVSPTWPPDSP